MAYEDGLLIVENDTSVFVSKLMCVWFGLMTGVRKLVSPCNAQGLLGVSLSPILRRALAVFEIMPTSER